MPLFDHFHSQLRDIYTWEAIHSAWGGEIAGALNDILPPRFTAIERQRFGSQVEIDIATYEDENLSAMSSSNGPATAVLQAAVWAPPVPLRTIPLVLPDTVEVKIFLHEGGSKLVGAIEIVSPGNKDRQEERDKFAGKCLGYLADGVSLIIIDVVTDRYANLHHELMKFLDPDTPPQSSAEKHLYASAFRPVIRGERTEMDIWTTTLSVGAALPTMPLRLTGNVFVPVDLESTYLEVCRRRRIT